MRHDSVYGTIVVAVALCFVCSLLVATSVVGLRSMQDANKVLSLKKNILTAADLIGKEGQKAPTAAEITELYDSKVQEYIVDLETGEVAEDSQQLAEEDWDPRKYLSDPGSVVNIPAENDVATLKKRTKKDYVYVVKSPEGKIETIILPMRGKGLWSMMWGFLALDADTRTVKNINFYEHGETPGLGAEIQNPNWVAKWPGKEVVDEQGDVVLRIVKGGVSGNPEVAKHQVDAISGSTITSRGVEKMLDYWLGDEAFGKFLEKVRSGSINL